MKNNTWNYKKTKKNNNQQLNFYKLNLRIKRFSLIGLRHLNVVFDI